MAIYLISILISLLHNGLCLCASLNIMLEQNRQWVCLITPIPGYLCLFRLLGAIPIVKNLKRGFSSKSETPW